MSSPRLSYLSPLGGAAWLVWLALLAWFSLSSNIQFDPGGWLEWDKFQHAAAYGVLGGLGGLACRRIWPAPWTGWLFGALVAVAVGVLLELAQLLLTASRRGEWLDLVADGCGILTVLGVALFMENRLAAWGKVGS